MAAMRDSMTLQRSRYRSLGQLAHVSSNPTTFRFTTDDGWPLVAEAHAPGAFRITVLPPGLAESARVTDLADLLAREEAIGEGELEKIEGGWRLIQGDTALEILTQPLRFRLVNREQCVLEAGSAEVGAISHCAEAQGEQAHW